MKMQLDISTGIDPVPCGYDIMADTVSFNVDGKIYTWDANALPFTVITVDMKFHSCKCADRALILKHSEAREQAL